MSLSQTPTGVPLEEAGRTWADLTGRVEGFIDAWESAAQPPRLADFLPAGPPALRRLALVELIKVDLEYRWLHRHDPRPVEGYLAEFPELAEGGVPCDLILEEYQVRKRAGQAARPEDYFARFPKQVDELGRLLGLAAPDQSTALFSGCPVEDLDVGGRVDDFDLLTRLGEGAFAHVFLARQCSMQRLVALKVSADRGSEPQTLAQLDHPHIVRVYDQRSLPDRGLRLLYMQYVPGGTLQEVVTLARKALPHERGGRTLLAAVDRALAQRGEDPPHSYGPQRQRLARLSWPEVVCWVGVRLAGALDYAARRGVLHRDVKPANVLLAADGSPRLADFNVGFSSKLEGASPAAFFGGSLPYMSPEHLDAFNPAHAAGPEAVDGRSDLYSLGVLLWELLTGRRPFPDEQLEASWPGTLERMAQRRREGLADLRARLPADCPPALAEALLTCLDPDPARRFPSGQELARQLALGLHPRAQKLFHPPEKSWRRTAARFPVLAVLLAGLWPNTLGAMFNFAYNRQLIATTLPRAEAAFWEEQLVINTVAFPLGIWLVMRLTRPVARGLAELRAGRTMEPDRLAGLRRRCLGLGHLIALVCLAEWLAAGPIYPLFMGLAVGGVPAGLFLHFVASLTLCGLIAVTYPFFHVSYLCVRVLYPPLARVGPTSPADLDGLARLARRAGGYLLLAAAVPMLAVAALVLTGSENRFALAVLSAGGLAGFGLAFWFYRTIQDDLQALVYAVHPSGPGAADAGSSLSSL